MRQIKPSYVPLSKSTPPTAFDDSVDSAVEHQAIHALPDFILSHLARHIHINALIPRLWASKWFQAVDLDMVAFAMALDEAFDDALLRQVAEHLEASGGMVQWSDADTLGKIVEMSTFRAAVGTGVDVELEWETFDRDLLVIW